MQTEQQLEMEELKKKEDKQAYILPIPFPKRLEKAKMEEHFSRFLDVFKKIEVNIPFAEALTQMPNYEKFLKDIMSKMRDFAEKLVVKLTATSSVVIQMSLPEKMQDSSSFTILCTIGGFEIKKVLCDSRSYINLIPLSMVKRLKLGELTPTAMTLQMEYRTMTQQKGLLEDVLIRWEI